MLRLIRYLKPFTLLILITIVLLFIQANADLALPDYLSRIVNTGIQQGGVENAVPRAIRSSEMDRLLIFLSAEDRATVLGDYMLVEQGSPDYDRYVKEYPVLAKEPVYVLEPIDQAETNRLNPIMGKAWLVISGIEAALADPAKAAALAESTGFDLSLLPPGTDIFALLAEQPPALLAQMTAAIDRRFAAMGDAMVVQAAVGAVKAEYGAIGLDTGKLQGDYILNIGIAMLLLSLLSGACTVAVGLLSARTAAGLARNLRRFVFQKVESFSAADAEAVLADSAAQPELTQIAGGND